jgi:glycosyltransferase involved in cell wall biosynthesis
LHLTLFDGFGLPVVEAFATGTPVLCSRTGSLEEIAGGAALHADPLDLDDMAAAIGRIHRDMELRETLRRNGLERARAFSVENNAEAWLTIHRRLAG